MERVLDINLYVHIGAGFATLIFFWIQIFSRKGSPLHVFSGRLFMPAGFMVAGAAATSVILRGHGAYQQGFTIFSDPDGFQAAAVLFYISVMVSVFLWAGAVLARYHHRTDDLPLPGLLLRAAIAITATAAFAAYVFILKPALWPALAGAFALGLNACWDQVKLLFHRGADPKRRLAEHVTNMFGAGLAFHVAFILLGSERFIDIWQWGAMPPIILVGVVILIGIFSEKRIRRSILRGPAASQ